MVELRNARIPLCMSQAMIWPCEKCQSCCFHVAKCAFFSKKAAGCRLETQFCKAGTLHHSLGIASLRFRYCTCDIFSKWCPTYIYIYNYTYILICTPQQCCKAIAQPKADAKTALNSKKRGFGAELMRLDMEFPQHISTSAGSQEDVSKCRCVACMPPRERERGRAG